MPLTEVRILSAATCQPPPSSGPPAPDHTTDHPRPSLRFQVTSPSTRNTPLLCLPPFACPILLRPLSKILLPLYVIRPTPNPRRPASCPLLPDAATANLTAVSLRRFVCFGAEEADAGAGAGTCVVQVVQALNSVGILPRVRCWGWGWGHEPVP